MDSLPPEFLIHHHPLLFFAGISPAASNPSTSIGAGESEPGFANPDPLDNLCNTLLQVVAPKGLNSSIWDPRKPHQTVPEFRVLLVDKVVRFPPRKARPNLAANATHSSSHSPLSPLSQTSPLFPDGIMSPIWIRKHRDMIPSVFVLTLKLWEPSSLIEGYQVLGNGLPSNGRTDPSELEQEKQFDLQLIHEIVDRKKTTTERGIKLAVVILTSRQMLDNPNLDNRLAHIRKQSGLDSRGSLFVLSPVPQHDMVEFVNTLKSELFEASIDYYREHSRRVRRKRSRSAASASVHSTIYSQPGQPVSVPLGPQGWSVRSDYKLATFAEFRQEYEVALKSYEDCWEGLSQMFGSTAVLPPRTKRWAEAKVLIDCISVKICKLYLYSLEQSRAVRQFKKHIQKFRDLCNGWGIGEETYEFWAWLAKQYTILADLVDIACRNGMRLPNLLPTQALASQRDASPAFIPADGLAIGRSATAGIGVASLLVHPGFYYYQSAECSVQRRSRFLAREAAEVEMRTLAESENRGADFVGSPALAHERKVNHVELIISLYTKAYEIFKKVGATRMTLFLALKIALIHLDEKDYETSIKFLERLLTSYRKERFQPILVNVLVSYYQALKEINLRDRASELASVSHTSGTFALLKLSLELIGQDHDVLPRDSQLQIGQYMAGLLKTVPQIPTNQLPIESSSASGMRCPVSCRLAFWSPFVELGDEVEFQLLITINELLGYCDIALASVSVQISPNFRITLEHQEEGSKQPEPFQKFVLNSVPRPALACKFDLRTSENSTWLVTGRLAPTAIGPLRLEKVTLGLQSPRGAGGIEVHTEPNSVYDSGDFPRWVQGYNYEVGKLQFLPTEALPSTCFVQAKVPRFSGVLDYEQYGLVGEERIIELQVISENEIDAIEIKLHLSLAPEFSGDSVRLEGLESNPLLGPTDFGLVGPKARVRRNLIFTPSPAAGSRTLRAVLNAQTGLASAALAATDVQPAGTVRTGNHVALTATFAVDEPFVIRSNVEFLHESRFNDSVPNFGCEPMNIWEDSTRAALSIHITCNPQVDLSLKSIELLCETSSVPTRICDPSQAVSGDRDACIDLVASTTFSRCYMIELCLPPHPKLVQGNLLRLMWSRLSSNSTYKRMVTIDIIPPPLQTISVITNLPSHLQMYQPCEICYYVQNHHLTHTMDMLVQIDPTEQWVFSGPRRIDHLLVLPKTHRKVMITALPVVMGEIDAPKIEVFQRLYKHQTSELNSPSHLISQIETMLDDDNRKLARDELLQLREVEVVREFSTSGTSSSSSTQDPRANSTPLLSRVRRLKVLVLPAF